MKTSLTSASARFALGTCLIVVVTRSFVITPSAEADPLAPCISPPPNLAAWWSAEGNADNIHNITNSGTLQGGVTFAPGMVGQAFTFFGNGAVNIPNQGTEGELNFQGSDFSIAVWVRFTGTLDPGAFPMIFQNYSDYSLYELYIDPSGPVDFLVRDFNGNFVGARSTTTLNDGLWHHVVGVRADKTGRIYVDGVEENNDTNPVVVGVNITCAYAHIGGGNTGPDFCYEEFAEENFFTGQLDEVTLFRRALTPTEVQAIYAAGASGMCGSTPTPTPTATAIANQPPVCNAGGPYSSLAVCQGITTFIQLDGTGSSDPDNDPLTYTWTTNCPGVMFDNANSATPTLTVTDSCPTNCTVTLTVSDAHFPPVSHDAVVDCIGNVVVFATNFETGPPPVFSGAGTLEGVQGYAGLGTAPSVFGGVFLRNTTGPSPLRTTLTVTGLPTHSSVSLQFLLAIIDSWDGSGCISGPDIFNVTVDGNVVFSEVMENSFCGTESYVPPPNVLLARRVGLFGANGGFFNDSAYDMSADPAFINIPHHSDTLSIEWFASGAGWQTGDDESWAIENVEVSVATLCAPSTPTPTPTATATPEEPSPTPTTTATATPEEPSPTPTATATASATATATATATPTSTPAYSAQIRSPINPDGTSIFNANRGVIPVKFTLTQDGSPTCALPPATIALARTAGGIVGPINESVYTMSADNGSNFRTDDCQYIYNLSASALGTGTYRVDIIIDGATVGSATFKLK